MEQNFEPLCGECPKILILGTFPSTLSRERGEYYGNPRNQFWRIIFDIFEREFNSDYSEKAALLYSNGLCLWDVVSSCEIEGALDANIRNPIYNTKIPEFVSQMGVKRVYFNGGNALTFYRRGIGQTLGIVLPSTSPANARMSYGEKLGIWRGALKPQNLL